MTEVAPAVPKTACGAVASEIAKYDGWDKQTMLAVAQAENTTCDPLRHNLTMSENHRVCVGSYGVLQVGCLHYKDSEDLNDLETNVAVAHRVFLKQGYSAWTMYNNGTYRRFL